MRTASGPVTGGFLDVSDDGPATDLDHDQRLSIVADVNYQPPDWFRQSQGYIRFWAYQRQSGWGCRTKRDCLISTRPRIPPLPGYLNLGLGHTLHMAGGSTFEPSLYITNLLNNVHLIKGAYFSGASWEEPETSFFGWLSIFDILRTAQALCD